MVGVEAIDFAARFAKVLRRVADAGQSDEGVLLDADEVKTLLTAIRSMAHRQK